MEYPLYDRLAEKAMTNPHQINMIRLATMINKNPETHEIIASLIAHHDAIQKGGISLGGVPYFGGDMSGGTRFRMEKIPPILQQILYVMFEELTE